MPAINVAKTDTFEQQRVKINQIGDQIFNITAGGSDLATGNLKIGDGTRIAPSLSFASDPSLGIYKPNLDVIGYVSKSRKIADFSPEAFYSYRDFIVRQNTISTSNIAILNNGQNYDAGIYTNVLLVGGTGEGAEATVEVDSFGGTINSVGLGYTPGTFSAIPLTGGTGTGTEVSFSVSALDVSITNAGSAYPPANYVNVPLTNLSSSGFDATADIVVSGTTTIPTSITNPGSGYTNATYTNVRFYNIPTTTYVVTATANPGTPPPVDVFVIDGNTQQSLTLTKGNTYKFDTSDATVSGHPFRFKPTVGESLNSQFYSIEIVGNEGTAGSCIYLIISPNAPTETIEYYCTNHSGMGATISIVSGTVGNYGYGSSGNVEISGGVVSSVSITSNGSSYKSGDQLTALTSDLGGAGGGLVFDLGNPIYNTTVTSVTIINSGKGYVSGDTLSANSADLGGVGSGLLLEVSNNPGTIENLDFDIKGSGYVIGDVLSLSTGVSNVSTRTNGSITESGVTLSTASPVVTVSDTTALSSGMTVTVTGESSVGQVAPGTTILTVDSPTQITLSSNPTVSGSANLFFVTVLPSTDIQISSVSGIEVGFLVEKVSGVGNLNIGTTVQSINSTTNVVTLSQSAATLGPIVVDFVPPYGVPLTNFEYQIDSLGSISTLNITNGGNGYSDLDELSVNAVDLTQPDTFSVTRLELQEFIVNSNVPDTDLLVGSQVFPPYGDVSSLTITSGTQIGGSATYSGISTTTTSGNGSGIVLSISRSAENGSLTNVVIEQPGSFYAKDDTITIPGNLIGGTTPADDAVLTVTGAIDPVGLTIYDRKTIGGFVDKILAEYDGKIYVAENFYPSGSTTPIGIFDSDGSVVYKIAIDGALTPDITLYEGSSYVFDLSDNSNTGHQFALSKYPGGQWGSSYIQNVSTVLNTASNQITVSNSTGILPGMSVSVTSGTGVLVANTLVNTVDNLTTITLDKAPLTSGAVVLSFSGTEYLQGVTRSATELKIVVSDTTPSLYFYDKEAVAGHDSEGIKYSTNSESIITIDPNNPKIFGSGFLASVTAVSSLDVMSVDVVNGTITAASVICDDISSASGTITGTLTAPTINGSIITADSITSSTSLGVSATSLNVAATTIQFGSTINFVPSSGNFTTSGVIQTTNSISVNSRLTISNNTISTTSGNDLNLSPATGRVVKVSSTSALQIPSGNTSQRPSAAVVANGAIRFNTQTNQYEGYSAASNSWSSLGGVRDLDGNTYITAEESVGSNDNTLWFYNDSINTVKFTPTHLEFVNQKSIRSPNVNAPAYVEWASNSPVVVGQYIKYRNNLYEVTVSGTTGTSGNEPVHTSGSLPNGTAELTWYTLAVSPLVFEDIEVLKIGPLGSLPLSVNSDLRFQNNTISTDISDLVIRPNPGKKVIIDAPTSLVIPSGADADRGIAIRGSIRFSQTTSQFEGYDGTNWGSLGGVKDVDQNTYIIPELSPGSNENILYFYNDNSNTLQLTTTSLDFYSIDTIRSVTSDELEITASLLTFDNGTSTFDNTATDRTFLHTTKQYFDLGLSAGLTTDPVLRLDDQGDVFLNIGFGTGTLDMVKVFDGDLKEFELADVKILTEKLTLVKGTSDNGSSELYAVATNAGCKTTVIAVNPTSGDKEFIEFGVLDDGTDVFHTEYGNIRTGTQLIVPTFEVTGSNVVRINIALGAGVNPTESVNITVVSNVTKK